MAPGLSLSRIQPANKRRPPIISTFTREPVTTHSSHQLWYTARAEDTGLFPGIFFSRGRGVSVSETYTQIYIAPKIVRTNPRAPLPILFEVCPLIQPEGLRECCKLPQRGPAENAFSCSKTHLWAVIYDLRDLTIARVPLEGVRATQTRGDGIFSRGWSLPSPEAAG